MDSVSENSVFGLLSEADISVYRRHGPLWLAARTLLRMSRFNRHTDDVRTLVEYIYDPESEKEIPATLRAHDKKAEYEEKRIRRSPISKRLIWT